MVLSQCVPRHGGGGGKSSEANIRCPSGRTLVSQARRRVTDTAPRSASHRLGHHYARAQQMPPVSPVSYRWEHTWLSVSREVRPNERPAPRWAVGVGHPRGATCRFCFSCCSRWWHSGTPAPDWSWWSTAQCPGANEKCAGPVYKCSGANEDYPGLGYHTPSWDQGVP